MKKNEIKQFNISEVDKITLLTIEQAKKISDHILCCDEWWWLQSPGYNQNYAAIVSRNGVVYGRGYDINYNCIGVRPAFKINNLECEIGDKVVINKTWCTVIDEDLILADFPICEHKFDDKSNNWKTSKLKKFMNSKEFISLL